MAKATRKQLAALRKARAAKRRYAHEAPRKKGRKRHPVKAHSRKGGRVKGYGRKGAYVKRHMSYEEARRRRAAARRRRAREAGEARGRRRGRRRGGPRRGQHLVRAHYSYEARRRGRRRRSHGHSYEARRRGRRHTRRYRGALENPLSGMELAITILTGSVGYMAAEIADRFMAIRAGAPVVTLAVNGGKAPQLPMYKDWPRLLVAAGITGAPLVASAFIKSPTWRSALQTMGIGAGLRTVGNILVGVAAQLTMPAADKPQSPADAKKNIFAFEQSLENAYDAWNKQTDDQKAAAEKAYEGVQGLPQGTGACPTCKRTDGLGACCGRQGAPPPQQQQPLPPPPPIAAPEVTPPTSSMTPPMVPQAPPAISTPPATPPPAISVPGAPPAIAQQPPTSTVPGPRGAPPAMPVSPPPIAQFAPNPPVGAGGGVRGIPQRFMAGTGSVAPRPKFNWGSDEAAE